MRVEVLKKRGLSQVVTTVLIILVVLAAVLIIWAAVRPTVERTGGEIGTGQFTVSYKIVSASLTGNENIDVRVNRKAGAGNVVGLNVILTDIEENSKVFREDVLIEELETKTVSVSYSGSGLGELKEVAIAPIFESNGKEKAGGIVDTYGLGRDGGGVSDCSDGIDNDGDGRIDMDDYQCYGPEDYTETSHLGGKRLLIWQSVGFSSITARAGVSNRTVFGDPNQSYRFGDGWNAHLNYSLRPIVRQVGPGAFDWYAHNPAGVWVDHAVVLNWNTNASTPQLFEELDIARSEYPELINYTDLVEFTNENGIKLYGHIGSARCKDGDSRFAFPPDWTHCLPEYYNRWYKEFIDFGFSGLAHDWSQNVPEDNPLLLNNFRYLDRLGIETFIEAVPNRSYPHLLGASVTADQIRWNYTEGRPLEFYTEQEINAAGGKTIHFINHPENWEGILENQFNNNRTAYDNWVLSWRYELAKNLLFNGKTVAVPLTGLYYAQADNSSINISELVRLSR